MHGAVLVGITPIVFLVVQFLRARLHHIVVDVGVLFLHDAFECGEMAVGLTILGLEAFHLAVGDTQREVGIG